MLLKNWKDKTMGRWVIKEIDYDIMNKEICVELTCIKCNITKSIKVKHLNKIKELDCIECKRENVGFSKSNKNNEDSVGISDLKEEDEPFKLINSERDRYIVDKLKRVWAAINNNGNGICEEWMESRERFEIWSLENDYRPWKVLEKYDKEFDYSPDNCYWKLDNRGISKVKEAVNKDNTLSNSVSYIKEISYSMDSVSIQLFMLKQLGLELVDSNYIENKENVVDCIRNIEECNSYINKCNELLNNIKLKLG